MAETVTCPACQAALQLGNVSAGQQIQCPRCQALVTVPTRDAVRAGITEELPPAVVPVSREETRPCPSCGQPIARTAQKCRHCKTWLEEEEEFYKPQFKPCPRCGATGANRVLFTFWGSFYGPALFTHVRCPRCGCAYNGRTGRSNLIPAIIFVTIPALLILGIIGGLILLIAKLGP